MYKKKISYFRLFFKSRFSPEIRFRIVHAAFTVRTYYISN
ncbi:Uncharacterized protein dnm_100080 [Desulfonema magnum]|uniref:Uncharacterized protein n=1 Tax=Desulfonema magnum TaxID=45655 RepID=A0A975GU87_9BACT|nr:Uncharacterized protein dnm_100080 [Desulfonema magnum]